MLLVGLIALLGCDPAVAAPRARSKLQPEEKEMAEGQNQKGKEEEAPPRPGTGEHKQDEGYHTKAYKQSNVR